MSAYYNENDPFAAQWLRNLIKAGHIAPGDVDERSIVDVRADDLRGYRQCHFFAGIGVWSYALRLSGWSDERPAWTGSCPCQPFSAAGKGQADEDDRHLAPVWLRLIRECRPAIVFGEQVGAAIRVGWLDALFTEMEQMHYACGAVDFPACSVGAPHIRQRLFFVADSTGERRTRLDALLRQEGGGSGAQAVLETAGSGATGDVGDTGGAGLAQQRRERGTPRGKAGADAGQAVERTDSPTNGCNAAGDVGDTETYGREVRWHLHGQMRGERLSEGRELGATNGFWRDADWLPCIDGKARPVEPGTFPLAYGAPARVGRLRAYGNTINPEQAAEFIRAYREVRRPA